MSKTITSIILEDCIKIHEIRDKQYGHSEKSFADIAAVSSRITGKDITAIDIAAIMIATKEHRYINLIKKQEADPEQIDNENFIADTVIDWINYIAIMENIRRHKYNVCIQVSSE